MKLDKLKLRQTVYQVVKLQRAAAKVGAADDSILALYATYLYCIISHGRGRLHMKWWNKDHPLVVDINNYEVSRWQWPGQFGVHFSTLVEQEAFMAQAKKHLAWFQKYRENNPEFAEFCKLPLDFQMPEEEPVVQVTEAVQN